MNRTRINTGKIRFLQHTVPPTPENDTTTIILFINIYINQLILYKQIVLRLDLINMIFMLLLQFN